MGAIAQYGQPRRFDSLDRANGVAFDTGYLDQAANRIAGQAEIMLHADLGRIFYLQRGSAPSSRQTGCSHRTGNTDFALAADFGAGNRGVLLEQ